MDYLYLVEGGSFFKVGITNNPTERIKGLQTGNPFNLVLLRSHAVLSHNKDYSPKHVENLLHKIMVDYRAVGEWFVANGSSYGLIKEVLHKLVKNDVLAENTETHALDDDKIWPEIVLSNYISKNEPSYVFSEVFLGRTDG